MDVEHQPTDLAGTDVEGCSGQLTQADGISVHPLPATRYQPAKRG
jgi:hypothetical protein